MPAQIRTMSHDVIRAIDIEEWLGVCCAVKLAADSQDSNMKALAGLALSGGVIHRRGSKALYSAV